MCAQVDDFTNGVGESVDPAGARKRQLVLLELLTRVMLALDGVRVPEVRCPPLINAQCVSTSS